MHPIKSTLLTIALSLPFPAYAGWGTKILFSECPAAVQTLVNKQGGHVDETRFLEKDGETVYRIEIERPAYKDLELYLSADGTVQRKIEELPWSAVPAVVREAAMLLVPENGQIDDATVEDRSGVKVYVVEIDRTDRADLHLHIDATGKVLQKEIETDD